MRILLACLFVSLLAACTSPSDKITSLHFGDAEALATTGNLRLITDRKRLQPDGSLLDTVCTEPSPDYAIAFGQSVAFDVKAAIQAQGSGEGSGKFDTTEVATQLAGRTAGVLALRDGLYAACQSYANGVIGHDAYAIILSQYGDLLVALVGGSGAATGSSGGASSSSSKPAEGGMSITVQNGGSATAPGAVPKSDKGASASAAVDPSRKSTLAALLVACISEYDPTRAGGGNASNPVNVILSRPFCRSVLAGALSVATKSLGRT